MPKINLTFKPGLFPEISEYGAPPHWQDGDKIRFFQGLPETIGGWALYTESLFGGGFAESQRSLRAAYPWTALDNNLYISCGTAIHWYILSGSTFYDITPVRSSGTLAGATDISVTNLSTEVDITLTSHGAAIGDRVNITGAAAVGGITISGDYLVTAVPDANTFTIEHSTPATSTATGGGASVAYVFYLPSGTADSELGAGWGVGGWGADGWGAPSEGGTTLTEARTWSFANWGEDLIGAPLNGDIYIWDTSVGTGTRASAISANSPLTRFILVSDGDRHLIAYGSDEASAGTIDPLLVHWADQEDYDTWAAAATNTAGSYRLHEGSKILCAAKTRGGIIIFTDTAVYSQRYLGPPYTFGFDLLSDNSGIIGPNAYTVQASRVYWWGQNKNFYVYDGAVRQIYCPLLISINDEVDMEQASKIWAVSNVRYNEIWWFYASTDPASNNIDKYIVYNYGEDIWYWGSMARTAGFDVGLLKNPIMFDSSGQCLIHETGTDAITSAITSTLESGDFFMEPGEHMMLADRLEVDAELAGNMTVSIETKDRPNGAEVIKGPYTINEDDDGKISFRAKGRSLKLTFGSSEVGASWRLQGTRIKARRAGQR